MSTCYLPAAAATPRRPGMPRCARPCLPQRAARSLLPEPKKAVIFSDFAGSGVDTEWAVQFRAVPDPAGFCLIVCLARALSAATQELTRKAPNRHPAPPRAVRGRPKSGCTIAHHGTRHDHPCTPGAGVGMSPADADRATRGARAPPFRPLTFRQRRWGNLPSQPTWTASVTASPSCRRASTPPPTNCCATCTSSTSSTDGRASAPAPTGSTGAPASTSAPPARSCA